MLLWLASCVPAPFGSHADDKKADGSRCDVNDECKSGSCGKNSRLCSHSYCDCPGDTCASGGETSPDCSIGWKCVYFETVLGDIGEAFNIDRDRDGGYCRPTCAAGCPEHYVCQDGMFCSPDSHWADPIPSVTWSGAVAGAQGGRNGKAQVQLEQGQTVELNASAESPLGFPLQTFEWTVTYESRSQEQQSGRSISIMLDEKTSYARAELSVRDADYRTGLFTVTFDGCFGAGRTCGYQGSGCCSECDKTNNTCM
jgi:hypothetical protein